MEHNLTGKVVLVTGASSGIGASVVRKLLEEGVKYVAMLDIDEEAGIRLQDELNTKYKEKKVEFMKCDVTDKQRILEVFKTVIDKYKNIDLVINSAGILADNAENYELEININLAALVTISLQAWNIMHKMKGGKGGTIINFSSIAAISHLASVPIYSATKAAVLKFSTTLGNELHYAKSGVRVIVMCFGLTDTPIMNKITVFDESANEVFNDDLKLLQMQSSEAAGNAVIETYKQGKSGSLWISLNSRPSLDLTETYIKSIDLFKDYIYN